VDKLWEWSRKFDANVWLVKLIWASLLSVVGMTAAIVSIARNIGA